MSGGLSEGSDTDSGGGVRGRGRGRVGRNFEQWPWGRGHFVDRTVERGYSEGRGLGIESCRGRGHHAYGRRGRGRHSSILPERAAEEETSARPKIYVQLTPPEQAAADVQDFKAREVTPRHGMAGQPLLVRADHFLMECKTHAAWQYSVDIERVRCPPCDASEGSTSLPLDMRRVVMNALAEREKWGTGWAFDGRNTLTVDQYVPHYVQSIEYEGSFEVWVKDPNSFRDEQFRVGITVVQKVSVVHLPLEDLKLYFKEQADSGQADYEAPQTDMQTLNITINLPATRSTGGPTLGAGSSKFNADQQVERGLGSDAEVSRSYTQSLGPVKTDLASTAFLPEESVVDFVCRVASLTGPDQISSMTFGQLKKANEAIFRLQVKAKPTGDKDWTYICKSLTPSGADKIIVADENGRAISMARCYEQKYNTILQYPGAPGLNVVSSKVTTMLPMEACKIAAGQRLLDKRETNSLSYTYLGEKRYVDTLL